MRTYFFKLLSLVFTLTAILMGLLLYSLSTKPDLVPEDRPVSVWQPKLELPPDLAEPVTQGYEITFARPVFSPSRRPFVPVAAPVEPEIQQPPQPVPEPAPGYDPNQFVLKGVMFKTDRATVLIATPEQANGVWLSQGSDLAGWKVEKIGKDTVTLTANGQSHVLKQYVDNSGERLGTQPANP
jgi:type II secretory pathway component PulC